MLEDLHKNFERLIALYEGAREESSSLRARVEELESANETYRKQIAELERQVDNLKLAEAFLAPAGGASDARQKVEKLIKEIDKCISLLER